MSAELTLDLPARWGTTGTSSTAGFISSQLSGVSSYLQRSVALGMVGAGIVNEVLEVYRDCQAPGWDGQRAKPVSIGSLIIAVNFLESLTNLGATGPSVTADPDGHITLEWYRNPNRAISLSLDPAGYFHYAALIGDSEVYGKEPVGDFAPPKILRLIREVADE